MFVVKAFFGRKLAGYVTLWGASWTIVQQPRVVWSFKEDAEKFAEEIRTKDPERSKKFILKVEEQPL